VFGGDGLYAESKLALEALFAKWKSERWSHALALVGAEIGWTRGTGLMNTNDLIADSVEKEVGLRTYSVTEMAFNLTALMTPAVMRLARESPLKCDISGGFHNVSGGIPSARLRQQLIDRAAINKAVTADAELDKQLAHAPTLVLKSALSTAPNRVKPRANLRLEFPELPNRSSHATVPSVLEGLIDLSRVPVIVGFGEVSPWGSARTRWARELSTEFTMEGTTVGSTSCSLARIAFLIIIVLLVDCNFIINSCD
jgi:fatty acid synthase subunit alpha